MASSTGVLSELCTLALVDPATHLLYFRNLSDQALLPVAGFDTHERFAAALTRLVRDRFGFNCLQVAMVGSSCGNMPCAILEILERLPGCPGDQPFCSLVNISSDSVDDSQKAAIARILANEQNPFGRFARLGLLEEVRRDMEADELCAVRQINCGIDFSMFSFRKGDLSYWFKAVGEPNTREYAVTMTLSKRAVPCLPKIIHVLPAWNGWIAEHIDGRRLSDCPNQWPCAFERLAALQRNSIGFVDELETCGAVDWTIPRLMEAMDPLFDEVDNAMKAQTSSRTDPIGTHDLRKLRTQIEGALLELEACHIPDTLVHGDLGHGNVLVSERGPIFLDWAETYIAHPFLSAEYLLVDLQRSAGFSDDEKAALLRGYASHWSQWIAGNALERLLAFTPAFGAISYAAMAFTAHRDRAFRDHVWPLLRSLMRKARREIERSSEVTA